MKRILIAVVTGWAPAAAFAQTTPSVATQVSDTLSASSSIVTANLPTILVISGAFAALALGQKLLSRGR